MKLERNIVRQVSLYLALASAGILSSYPVIAQSFNVQFSGNLPSRCIFSNIAGGTLVQSSRNERRITSNEPGGSPGGASVSCNADSELIVRAPVQVQGGSAPMIDDISRAEATVTDGSSTINSRNNQSILIEGNSEPVDLTVNMFVERRRNAFPAGTYFYDVEIVVSAL